MLQSTRVVVLIHVSMYTSMVILTCVSIFLTNHITYNMTFLIYFSNL